MTQCKRCRKVKFWFQMYSKFLGIYTATFEICKLCANDLKYEAVMDYLDLSYKRKNAKSSD